VFRESTALNPYFEEILNKTLQRMKAMPMQDHLKRHLVLIFICAISYNSAASFKYMDAAGITTEMMG